ncbi:MAG: hypothetical protein K0R39_1962 [Symbiobacteriaceae bacterium]|jgi:hypothetical protein|nr:hypothetical protein [Symbiobacteriaceae bacterium]
MRKWYPALLVILLLLLTACAKPKPEPVVEAGPTLADIHQLAKEALDSNRTSKERQPAREKAMSRLVQLLRTPESLAMTKAQWESPIEADEPAQLRFFEAGGKARVYALTIPASGIVPPGERVAVQYAESGAPQAFEVEVMPGGQLVGARAFDDRGVMLVFGLARGGGYIGYYARDGRTGEFKPDTAPFRGLAATVGDVRLELRSNFLLVDVPVDTAWSPQFDKANQARFYINPDLALEWKSPKFNVIDERNFTAFDGFMTAADTSAKKEERLEAWEKATRKLPAYLQQVETVEEQLLSKLPAGSREQMDRSSSLTARLLVVPAPAGLEVPSFSILQYRIGNGLPMTSPPPVNGRVEALRIVEGEGQPGLAILTASASGKGRVVTLLRMNGGNGWEPAPEWYGFLPTSGAGVRITRGPGPADLTIETDDAAGTVAMQPDRSVQICPTANAANCFSLAWIGQRLSAASWVTAQIRQIATLEQLTTTRVMEVAELAKQYLLAPESASLSAAQLASMVGAPPELAPRGWDIFGARVLAFPPNGSGLMPLLVQSGKTITVETYAPRTITKWLDAREMQAGGQRWLLVLGRSNGSASVLLYQFVGSAWQPVNALSQETNHPIGPSSRILYKPGQTDPVRGLYVAGTTELKAFFTPAGNGVAFCEGILPCTVYQFDNHWVLK